MDIIRTSNKFMENKLTLVSFVNTSFAVTNKFIIGYVYSRLSSWHLVCD